MGSHFTPTSAVVLRDKSTRGESFSRYGFFSFIGTLQDYSAGNNDWLLCLPAVQQMSASCSLKKKKKKPVSFKMNGAVALC